MRIPVLTAAALASLVVCAPSAQASILFFDGPGAVQPEENLFFNGAGLIAGPAMTVTGRTNQTDTIFSLTGRRTS